MYIQKQFTLSKTLTLASAISIALAGSTGVYAQRSQQIEEVVVTAERRDATEQTTAISMEVFTNEDLATRNIQTIQGMMDFMPSLQIQDDGLSNNINIRGVGNNQRSAVVQMGVQVIVDGHSHGEPMGMNGAFFDIGTIEVLRGPQGTFVGQSAAGGAILINSERPNFDGINGYAETTFGNFGRSKFQTAINLPWSDTLAMRLAVNTEERDSYYENIGGIQSLYGEELFSPGSLSDRQTRLSLLWQPTSQFEAMFKYENNHVNHMGDPRKPNPRPVAGVTVGDHDNNPATPDQPFETITYSQYLNYQPSDPFTINQVNPASDSQRTQLFSMIASYELQNGMSVDGRISRSLLYNRVYRNEHGPLPERYGVYQLGPGNRTTSGELTLSSADTPNNWIIGAFMSKRVTPVKHTNVQDPRLPNCGWQANGTHIDCEGLVELTAPLAYRFRDRPAFFDNYALFGQYNYALNNEIELTAGLRYNYDTSRREFDYAVSGDPDKYAIGDRISRIELTGLCKDMRLGTQGNAFSLDDWYCGVGGDPTLDIENLDVDQKVPTYKFGVNWTPSDNQFIYAFYARGYKAGNVNGTRGVDPEYVDDYELGWKGTLLNGALSANLGYYYMDYKDMQGSRFFNNNPQGSGDDRENIGDSTIYGIEGSFKAFIGEFSIGGSFSWNQTDLSPVTSLNEGLLPSWSEQPSGSDFDFLPQCGLDASLNDPATGTNVGNCFDFTDYLISYGNLEQLMSPEMAYNLTADYQIQLRSGTLLPSITYTHTDKSWNSLVQTTDYYKNDARDLVNLSLTYTREDWTIQAFMNNTNDEVYIASATDEVRYGDPRTYGVRVRLNF